ncbi:MAG TPA: sensor histidine kinase [Anaerolineales bacterium]|nr:sensor histidine kinase [Anaerolineales bacterium]
MRIVGAYLIFTAVVLRAAVVVSTEPEFPAVIALLAGYGLLLSGETWSMHRKPSRFLQSPRSQLTYLVLQSVLVITVLIVASYEDFLAMLFLPLSLNAVAFFGRRVGYTVIAIFSAAMTLTLLFSDVGPLFGMVMGILYSGICFLFGGYAHQVQKAEAARDQNVRMLSELQVAHRQLQRYADQKANLAIEHERNRLARELHDSVTQTVFSMNLAAQSAQLLLGKERHRAAGQLLHIEELAASALREIQTLVSQLRPRSVVEDGLPNALRRLAQEVKMREGLQVSMEIHGEQTFSERTATSLYFIAHEALINVAKHSGVCEATIHLNLVQEHSYLAIEDRGRGFDLEAAVDQRGHLGLTGISERAREIGWSLSIWSRPGQGTRISVTENPSGGSR